MTPIDFTDDDALAMATAPAAEPATLAALRLAAAADPALGARLAQLRMVDALVAACPQPEPAAATLERVRQRLSAAASRVAPPPPAHDIMTLPEVAAFLRLPAAAFAELVDELPSFELAGVPLVRRERLLAWIAEREQAMQAAKWHQQCTLARRAGAVA